MGHQGQFFTQSLFNEAERERWREDGAGLIKRHDNHQWELGEWVDTGVSGLTKKTALFEAMKITGYAKTTLWDFSRTANAFPEKSRRRELSWSHHKEVAITKLSAEKRYELLDRACEDKWSIQELRSNVKNELSKGKEPNKGEPRRNIQASVTKATYAFLTRLAKKQVPRANRATFIGEILENYRRQQEPSIEAHRKTLKSQKTVARRQRPTKTKWKQVA